MEGHLGIKQPLQTPHLDVEVDIHNELFVQI